MVDFQSRDTSRGYGDDEDEEGDDAEADADDGDAGEAEAETEPAEESAERTEGADAETTGDDTAESEGGTDGASADGATAEGAESGTGDDPLAPSSGSVQGGGTADNTDDHPFADADGADGADGADAAPSTDAGGTVDHSSSEPASEGDHAREGADHAESGARSTGSSTPSQDPGDHPDGAAEHAHGPNEGSHDPGTHSHDSGGHSHDHAHGAEVDLLGVAVVTVSSTRTREDDASGDVIEAAVEAADHEVVTREILRDDLDGVQTALLNLTGRDDVDVVVTTGGTGVTPDDVTVEAARPLFDRELPGFGELFRILSYEEIGTRAMVSRATAGMVDGVPVFCLPGSEAAARLGTEELVVEEMAHLVSLARRDD